MKNLRDNEDGTCNCRPLGAGCFFTDGFDGPCDCKCHHPFSCDQSKLEAPASEGWEAEPHQTENGWCCACEADIARFESLRDQAYQDGALRQAEMDADVCAQSRQEARREVLEEARERINGLETIDGSVTDGFKAVVLNIINQLKEGK